MRPENRNSAMPVPTASSRVQSKENREVRTFHTFPKEAFVGGGRSMLLVAHCLLGFGPIVNSKTPPAAISLCRIHARDSALPFSRALCT